MRRSRRRCWRRRLGEPNIGFQRFTIVTNSTLNRIWWQSAVNLRQIFCTMLLLTAVSHGAAQTVAQPNNWGLRVVPLKLLDPVNPGLQGQIERQLSRRFSAQLTGAWLFKGFSSYYLSLNGVRGLLGVKYFFAEAGDADDRARFYVMAEGGAAVAVHRRDGFFAPPRDTFGQLQIDRYRTNKQTVYYAVRIGTQAAFARRWHLDFSLGIGIKHRYVRHSERDVPAYVLTLQEPRMLSFSFSGLQEGRSVWLNVPATLGVGYSFGR